MTPIRNAKPNWLRTLPMRKPRSSALARCAMPCRDRGEGTLAGYTFFPAPPEYRLRPQGRRSVTGCRVVQAECKPLSLNDPLSDIRIGGFFFAPDALRQISVHRVMMLP